MVYKSIILINNVRTGIPFFNDTGLTQIRNLIEKIKTRVSEITILLGYEYSERINDLKLILDSIYDEKSQ